MGQYFALEHSTHFLFGRRHWGEDAAEREVEHCLNIHTDKYIQSEIPVHLTLLLILNMRLLT
jgi:hypothetical protein